MNRLIIGDLNLDFVKWDLPDLHNSLMVQMIKDEIEMIGFVQLVRNITQLWPGQEDSIVDNVWTNKPDRIVSHSNVIQAGSDHNVISVLMRMKDRIINKQEIYKRSRRNMNSQHAKDKMSNFDWSNLYQSKDVNIINYILVSNIITVLDEEAPLKTVQVRKNYKKWVDPNLRGIMKDRDKSREKILGGKSDWDSYRKKRNSVTQETRKCKNRFLKKIYDKL